MLRSRSIEFSARLLLVLAIIFCFAPIVWGDEALSPELEQEAKAIDGLIIAPCCWRQPVSVHFSPAADEVRAEVREMLASGLKREDILDKYIAEYGERILAKPPAEGFGVLAYFLPVLFLGLGAAVAVVVIKRLRPQKAEVKTRVQESGKVSSKLSKRLEEEMWG